MAKRLDKETEKVLSEGEMAEALVKDEKWLWAKRRLFSKLIVFDSATSIEAQGRPFDEVGREVAMRQAAVEMVLNWFKDIEGLSQQHVNNREIMQAEREDSIIRMFD